MLHIKDYSALVAAALMFWAVYAETNKKLIVHDAITKGVLITATVSKLSNYCGSSRSIIMVLLNDKVELPLKLNAAACDTVQLNDKINVYYSEKHQNLVRCTEANTNRQVNNQRYTFEIIMFIVACFFVSAAFIPYKLFKR